MGFALVPKMYPTGTAASESRVRLRLGQLFSRFVQRAARPTELKDVHLRANERTDPRTNSSPRAPRGGEQRDGRTFAQNWEGHGAS